MRTKLNVLLSSQLKKNFYDIVNSKKNVEFFFYHGDLEKFVSDKKIIDDINKILNEGKSYKNSKASKIIFIIIECQSYYDINDTSEINEFNLISKQILNEFKSRESLVFIINNKKAKKVSYDKQIQSLTKEISINDDDFTDKEENNINKIDSISDEKINHNEEKIESKTDDTTEEIADQKIINEKTGMVEKDSAQEKNETIYEVENKNDDKEILDDFEIEYEEVQIKKNESYKPKQVENKQPIKYQYINNDDQRVEKSKIDYDNILWMDNDNKHMFEGKEPKTRVVYLNQVNSKFNKEIELNSSIDEEMLNNNKIKIDVE